MQTDDAIQLAVRDNAEWCAAMCRAHGLTSTYTGSVWACAQRTPTYYPDAVTLRPDATSADVLAGIDAAPGASVKDSFARLDLSADGFEVLLSAQWIHRPAAPVADAPDWRPVRDPDALRDWARAWGGPDVFRPELLTDPTVVVLAEWHGTEVVAGAVASLGTGGACGISNLFAADGDEPHAWAGALAAAYRLFPTRPVVGYEEGAALDAAVRAGCIPLAPLRIWYHPA